MDAILLAGIDGNGFHESNRSKWRAGGVSPLILDAELLRRPHRQLLAEDLGVVPNVGWQQVHEKDVLDAGGVRILGTKLKQLSNKAHFIVLVPWPLLRPRLRDDHRPLLAGGTDTDESRAINPRMLIENRFTGYRKERSARGNDPVALPPTKPEPLIPALRFPYPFLFSLFFLRALCVSAVIL